MTAYAKKNCSAAGGERGILTKRGGIIEMGKWGAKPNARRPRRKELGGEKSSRKDQRPAI